MSFKYKIFFILFIFTLGISCNTQKYFHDPVSQKRQKELKSHRSGNIFSDIGLTIASIFVLATVDVDMNLYPEGQEFKKLKIINPTNDTLYVNMLTDVFWDEENYCDFMDIRIPAKSKCKVLVPVDANYNLYFSNTVQSDDDELLEINTNDLKKVSLYPGLTKIDEDFNLNQK